MNMETYILKALQKKVTEAVGNTIHVKYLNVNFTVPANGKWWEIVYIPNNVRDQFWAEGKTYQGVMRLILHWPQNSGGAYAAMEEVRRVSDFFNKGDKFQDPDENVTVKIQEHPDVTSVIEESPQLLIPLTIRYSCFKI